MERKFRWAVLTIACLLMVLALGKLSAEETKERLVLLPVSGENLPGGDLDLFQGAIKEGFSSTYEIFSGEQVQAKLQKFAISSCTSDECLENIAIAFQGHLVGRGFVVKEDKDYFLRIEIKDVFTDKDVFTKTDGCSSCSKSEIMKKFKAMTGGGSVSASAPGAVEFASSSSPDKGPTEGAVSRITPKVSGDSGSTVAALFLDSEPSGAAVYLGDIVAGETPYQNMGLKAGQTLRIVLKKDDYHPQTIELKLSGGTNEIDTVKLKPWFGSLSVTSEPAGADVFLAGKKVGATPYKNAKVLSGTYLLSVRKDLYASVENQTIQIMDEKATVKNVSLQADFGTLDVASTPAGARADVSRKSGKTVHEDKTPFSVRLSPGTYEVHLEKEGYDSVSYTVTVNLNGKQSIDAASAVLRRLEGTVIVSSEPYEKGAEVRVDGELKGHVPATLTVSAGDHEIAVKGKKLQGKQKVAVKDRETVTAQVELKEEGDKVYANPGTEELEYQKKLAVDQLKKIQSILRPNEGKVLIDGKNVIVRLSGIVFASGSSVIEPKFFGILTKTIRIFEEFEGCTIMVQGHTDDVGNEKINLKYSNDMADSVEQFFLANSSITNKRITSIGLGSSQPVAKNSTKAGRELNRRIDVIIIPDVN